MKKFKKSQGITLVETIIVMIILSFMAVVCIVLLTSALLTKKESEDAIKQHVALRQAVLAFTREIRIEGFPFIKPYNLDLTTGELSLDDITIAKNIASFDIATDLDTKKAKIYIESTGGQWVTTQIHLRN